MQLTCEQIEQARKEVSKKTYPSGQAVGGSGGYTPIYRYNTMVKICGGEITFKRYKKEQYAGYSKKKSGSAMTEKQIEEYYSKIGQEKTEYEKRNRFHKSVMRSRENIFDLIACNVGKHYDDEDKKHTTKFVTLTFNRELEYIKTANREFMLFIKRLNNTLFGAGAGAVLKYICIPELQARGTWHFHVVFFNLPFIPVNMKKAKEYSKKKRLRDKMQGFINLEDIWKNGFVYINVIENETRAAAYITKYLTKGIDIKEGKIEYKTVGENDGLKRLGDYDLYKNFGLENMKRYQASRGLYKALKRYIQIDKLSFMGILKEYHKNGQLETLNKEGATMKAFQYKNEYRGEIMFFNFRLKKEHIPMFRMMVYALSTLYKYRKKQSIPNSNKAPDLSIENLGLIRHTYIEKAKNLTNYAYYNKLYIS
jgi:hypothetical protein